MKQKTLQKWVVSLSACVMTLSAPLSSIRAFAEQDMPPAIYEQNATISEETPLTTPETPVEAPESPTEAPETPKEINPPTEEPATPESPNETEPENKKHPAQEMLDNLNSNILKKLLVQDKLADLKKNYSLDEAKFVAELMVFFNGKDIDKLIFVEDLKSTVTAKKPQDLNAVINHLAQFAYDHFVNDFQKVSLSESEADYMFANSILYYVTDTQLAEKLRNGLSKYEKEVFKPVDEGLEIPQLFPGPSTGDPFTIRPKDIVDNNYKPGVTEDDLSWNKPQKYDLSKYQFGTYGINNYTNSDIPYPMGIGSGFVNSYNILLTFQQAFEELGMEYKDLYGEKIGEEDYPLSTLTIQYTLEKDEDSPIYHDTGIYIGLDGTISYADAVSALKQIAIKAKKPFVDDEKRALSLIDGKVLMVEDTGERMSVANFLVLFEETSIGVKAQDTRSGNTLELVDLVELRRVVSLYVNNEPVMLEARPIVDNSIVLFPLESLANAMGGKVSATDTSTTIVIGQHRFEFTDGQTSMYVNGKATDLGVEIRKTKDGVRVAPVQALLDTLGYALEVKTDKEEVHVIKKAELNKEKEEG